jgi:hypothetical protein
MWTWLFRLFCRHPDLMARANSPAVPFEWQKVAVGLTIRCEQCGRWWAASVHAECPEAWKAFEPDDPDFADLPGGRPGEIDLDDPDSFDQSF